MDYSDRQRRAREEARNSLESFVYYVQDFLQNEEVLHVSTDSQRVELSSKLSETSDWLYGEGEEAQTSEFITRLSNLKFVEFYKKAFIIYHEKQRDLLNILFDLDHL